jgi:hypothetical protein
MLRLVNGSSAGGGAAFSTRLRLRFVLAVAGRVRFT